MMHIGRLQAMLAVAEQRRTTGAPNSDAFVARKLREDRLERSDFFKKIMHDESVASMVAELGSEIASIEHALTAYPELATA